MPISYAFTTINEAQIQRRRYLLDSYGQLAQWSVLFPLFTYQTLLFSRFLFHKSVASSKEKTKRHASPLVSRFDEQSVTLKSSEVSRWNLFQWLLDQDVLLGVSSSSGGTWRVLLIASAWTIWLSVLAVRDTGHDYLHLTKRFGIIGASQLPLHYLLAFKSSWSPISYLTRLSHEELNPYHRALGRIILIFFSLHASFYLNFFIQKSLLTKRIRDPDVILGILAITIFLLLGTTALSWLRRRYYFLFFLIHIATSIAILPILYFHVAHLRIYILEATIIYILLIAQRNISLVKITSATLSHIPLTNNLLSLTIPLTNSTSNLSHRNFHPGQHIYLSFPTHQSRLRLNPFTIANLPQKTNHIRLILRTRNGTTRNLSGIIDPNKTTITNIPLSIEGPYGAAANFPDFRDYDRILFVAGGVGATFTLPIYQSIIARGLHASKMRFVWAVKNESDAAWAVEYLSEEEMSGVEIYTTGGGRRVNPAGSGTPRKEEEVEAGIELQQRARLMSDVENSEFGATTSSSSPPPSSSAPPLDMSSSVRIFQGRPNFSAIINEVFSANPDTSPPTKLAVLVCGPAAMGGALRREVGVWVGRGKDIWWHNEGFSCNPWYRYRNKPAPRSINQNQSSSSQPLSFLRLERIPDIPAAHPIDSPVERGIGRHTFPV
ncbi:MAG: hypothetical protein Q9172_002517 [Xanthocarpia lactea]